MVILREEKKLKPEQLNEMSLRPISSRQDGLPFRIAIKSPDHKPPHAHVMDLKTGKIELGQFEIPQKPPNSSKDIKNYKQGITDEMRELIFNWLKQPHRVLPKNSNWEALYLDWIRNEKW